MKCEICGCKVYGEVEVSEAHLAENDTYIIKVDENERNWICCDSCNKIICHKCCKNPATGYCDACLGSINRHEYLRKAD